MFSSIFGKRRSSPVEDEGVPIPGPRSDDFVVVDPVPPGGNLYPGIPSGVLPKRPAPALPQQARATIDHTFHYLQGVPFSMCRELQMASNQDTVTMEVANLLAFLTNKLNINSSSTYDFSVEKSVLKEC